MLRRLTTSFITTRIPLHKPSCASLVSPVRLFSGCGTPSDGEGAPAPGPKVDLAEAFKRVRSFSDEEVKRMLMEVEDFEEEMRAKEAAEPPPRNPKTGEWYGPKGEEPTRFGDWERGARVSDF
jgi:hypothetical protein